MLIGDGIFYTCNSLCYFRYLGAQILIPGGYDELCWFGGLNLFKILVANNIVWIIFKFNIDYPS